MRLVAISDTHGLHKRVQIPDGDVLIHAGDFMNGGYDTREARSFFDWFTTQPHSHKICIAGNHDRIFEISPSLAKTMVPNNITYLEDSGIAIDGVRFWGSPVTPSFMGWSFNRDRGPAIDRHWQKIPQSTNVLVTHGPPMGRLDYSLYDGTHVGCRDLLLAVQRIKPRYHVFGHIHAGHGVETPEGSETTFVNAAVCNEQYRPINPPVVIDL